MNRNKNKVGQYWTPEQAAELMTWWNSRPTRPRVHLDGHHLSLLNTADLVHGGDTSHVRINVGGELLPLCAFLYACEMLRDSSTGAAYCRAVYKGRHETDPRWIEMQVPGVIRALGLPLTFKVWERNADGQLVEVVGI